MRGLDAPDVVAGSPRPLRLSRSAGFVAASAALATVFLASGTPIPLYNTYRVENSVTNHDLAITTVAYLGMTAVALLVFGRLSNHLGRKPVAMAAVVAATAGLVALTFVDGLGLLLLGRVLQGLACGLASSALGAWVIDLAPPRPPWLPAFLTGTLPTSILPIGAVVSGALAAYGPAPRTLMFTIVIVVFAGLALLLVLTPETVRRSSGTMAALAPRMHIPQGQGRLLFAVGAALVATWSFSGFYQAFSPALTADHLGTANPLVIAVVFSSIVILAPVGGVAVGRMPRTIALRMGLALFSLGAIVAIVALHAANLGVFLAASYLAGVALGMVGTSGMGALLAHTAPGDRAGVLASTYLISYGGAAIPGLVSGPLSATVEVPDIAVGYVLLVVVASLVSVLALPRGRRRGSRHPDRHPAGVARAATESAAETSMTEGKEAHVDLADNGML